MSRRHSRRVLLGIGIASVVLTVGYVLGGVNFLISLLVVMAVPPVAAACVLWRFRNSDSAALRERSYLSLVLAALAVVVAGLALNRLLGWGLSGDLVTLPLVLIILLTDVAAGRWLWQFWTGGFIERTGGGPETAIELEDRTVGDERRRLQAEAAEDTEDTEDD